MKRSIVIVVLITLGCSTTRVSPEPPEPTYAFEVARGPAGFDLEFVSLDSKAICLFSEEWPDKQGWVEAAATMLQLSANGKNYQGTSEYGRFCPGGCPPVIVMPGERIQAHVSFENFVDIDLPLNEKLDIRLEYDLSPYYCREAP